MLQPKGKKYIALQSGRRVRFLKSSKYDYDFKKGDTGQIQRVISPLPFATDTIYLVACDSSEGELVWVTGKDIEPFDQLKLLENTKVSKALCGAVYYKDVTCIRGSGHHDLHQAQGGLQWAFSLGSNPPWMSGDE